MSLDLEDARLHSIDGMNYPSRVEKNTEAFISFLKTKEWPCTFFTVGNIFESYPELIKLIRDQGFEIGWHSSQHEPVASITEDQFYSDLMKGRDLASKFGISMLGYRAPIFSVNQSTPWFHKTLKKAGFKYSSSILPAANPLFGWPEFGDRPVVKDDVLEIPMPLVDLKLLKVPFGGVYLRTFPSSVFKYAVSNRKNSNLPIATYIHPYDFDSQQERYTHGGINGSAFYNFLMYYNRSKMLNRIEKLARACSGSVLNYADFYRKQKD